jgi:catechol 2,3-dioxygenase-like lactoylglutathione lyase family enzyme
MNPHLAVVSLWAEDVPAAAHFYRDVIGLRLMPHHASDPKHARLHFDLGGVILTLLKGRPVAAQDARPERFPLVAFAVDDLDAMVARLRAHDVALPWGVEDDAGARWVMFHDPAGNLVEVAQFKE